MRPDGSVIAVEQVLTQANLARVVAGKTTAKEVRELLGPPSITTRWWLRDVDEWDYLVLADNRFHDFLIEFSAGGVVSKTTLLHDAVYDAGGTLP
jgi:outer membrane protein assembly factor BamE (lipoprotein component of BamABCDE complex)